MKKRVERKVRGTNIRVVSLKEAADPRIAILNSILPDDPATSELHESLRPPRRLIHPSESFAQAQKKLAPAINFCTYDAVTARAKRIEKREKQAAVAEKRRKARLAPTKTAKAVQSATADDVADMDAEVARLFAKKRRLLPAPLPDPAPVPGATRAPASTGKPRGLSEAKKRRKVRLHE